VAQQASAGRDPARLGAATLVDVYEKRASLTPDRVAVRFAAGSHAGRRLTCADVCNLSTQLASRLTRVGVGAGTRCGVVLEHHPMLLPVLLALWRSDCIVVPLDPSWGSDLRATIVRHSGIRTIVSATEQPDTDVERYGAGPAASVGPGTAMISYTSGSTSDPKGVILRHRHLISAYRAAAAGLKQLTGHEVHRMGCSMRLSGLGVLGMHYLWAAVLDAEVVLLRELSVRTASDYLDEIEEQRIDTTYLVPPLLELVNRVTRSRPHPMLRTVLTGGAPLPAATRQRFNERFDPLLLNAYGLTEAAFAAFLGDRDQQGRGTGRIGRPVTVEARLRGDGGAILAHSGRGELELRGPCVSDGYHDNPRANAALFTADGWLRSGDVAHRDDDGAYTIVGRRKLAVMKGAHTIFLNEVEDAAADLPDVVEAAAVPLNLPSGGEDIGLLVRGSSTVNARDVAVALTRRLGRQRAPRQVVLTTDPLPRLNLHKVDRRAVRRIWDELTTPTQERTTHGG